MLEVDRLSRMESESPSYVLVEETSFHSSSRTRTYRRQYQLPSIKFDARIDQSCLACGQVTCALKSHMTYSDRFRAILPHKSLAHNRQVVSTTTAPREITNSRIDPFAKYPIPMTSEEHEVLDNWARPWGSDSHPERHLFPSRHIDVFLPSAMASPLLMRVALNLITTHTSLPRRQISEAAYVQQRKALELHLQTNQDEKQINSDENILAALNIMANYSAHGDVQQAMQLMQGIYSMVQARGGLHQLGMNGQVAVYAGLADHVFSLLAGCEPTFSYPLPSLQFPGIKRRSGTGFEKLHRLGKLSTKLLDAALDLCRAFNLFDDGWHGRVEKNQLQAFHYLSSIAEYQLACVSATTDKDSIRESCICLALLILDHVILRNLGNIAPVVRVLEGKFWATFRAAEERGVWEVEDRYSLMWLLFSPLVIAVRGPCEHIDYAVERLKAMRVKAGINTIGELEHSVLRPFLYFRLSQGDLLLDIWKRIK